MENKVIEMETAEIPEEDRKKIEDILKEIKSSQEMNEVNPQKLYELHYYLNELKDRDYEKSPIISDLFTDNLIFFFRTLILQEKKIRIIILKILRNRVRNRRS